MTEQVINSVIGWLARGATEPQVKQAIRESVTGADADEIYAAALQRLRDEGMIDNQFVRGWANTAYRGLINKMLEIGDLDGARKAIDNVVKLAAAGDGRAADEMDQILEWGYIHGAEIDHAER